MKSGDTIITGVLELSDWWNDEPIIKVVPVHGDEEFFYSCEHWRLI